MASPYTMHSRELPPSKYIKPKSSFPEYLAFTYTLDGTIQKAMSFSGSLDIPECSVTNFQYWSLAPILESGWALLGELTKIISISETRFTDVIVIDGTYMVYMIGVPEEVVPITAYDTESNKSEVYTCIIGPSGTSVLYLPGGPCKEA